MMQAPRYGMSPDQFAQALVEAGQVPMAVSEVRRGKALAVVLQSAVITDTNGTAIDLSELDRPEVDMEAMIAQAMAEAEAAGLDEDSDEITTEAELEASYETDADVQAADAAAEAEEAEERRSEDS